MHDYKKVQAKFHAECIECFRKTYSFLRGKKVYIYGSGEYGQLLAKALIKYDCIGKDDVLSFVNDFANGFDIQIENRKITVIKLDECDFGQEYCVVVAIRNNKAILEKLAGKGIAYFADSEIGVGTVLLPLCFHESGWSVWDINLRFKQYAELNLPEDEMRMFYDDEESLAVLNNRLEFYRTGDRKLLETCPLGKVQYFEEGLLDFGTEEVFLDLGAYTGDTAIAFAKRTNGKYRKIISFEPDHQTVQTLKRNTAGLHDMELVEAATGEYDGEVQFAEGLGSSSFISSEQGSRTVKVLKLDGLIKDPVTFVKMDIEGAELETLRGMKNLIKANRPKLAICVYHKLEDLWTIPHYLKQLVPDYRFKLRQYEIGMIETVLYAF